ncbi:MAG: cytochrome c3 family protein [Anaeromyxobacteraceae bacterium]
MKKPKLLFVAVTTLVGISVVALDPPHDGSFGGVTQCQSCHKLHGGGGTLLGNNYTSNNDSCLSCHDGTAKSNNTFFSTAWSSPQREALPGSYGDHHKWSGSPTGAGATLPTNPALAAYLPSTSATLQCAVCHDAHGAKDATGLPVQDQFAPNSAHASYKLNVPQPPVGGEAGTLTLLRINDGGFAPLPSGYAVRVKDDAAYSGAGASGNLEISHNYGSVTPTWSGAIPFTSGASAPEVYLDDPSVVVRISTAPARLATWQFYVSYPLLRASNVADAMCTDCHADRHQDHLCVEGNSSSTDGAGKPCTPNGTDRYYSHPVNQPLGANGAGYDAAAPLDADGSSADSNASNDLVLDGNNVRCTTCHAPHNADSNSLSVEVR